MKPESYLTKEGKEIFNRILKFVQDKNIVEDIDSLGLSALANAYDLHAKAAEEIGGVGAIQTTPNGYEQVSANFTVWKQTGEYIKNHADKYGLNPSAREKIKSISNKKGKHIEMSTTERLNKYK